jgi:hypothetical protein
MGWRHIQWEKAVDIVYGGDQGRLVFAVKGAGFLGSKLRDLASRVLFCGTRQKAEVRLDWDEAEIVFANTLESLGEEVKNGQARNALCQAIQDTGQLLSKHFPTAAGDTNELPDAVIIEKTKKWSPAD